MLRQGPVSVFPPGTTGSSPLVVFKLFHTKDLKKKHKNFDEGIGKQENGRTTVFTMEGERIAETQKIKWFWDTDVEKETMIVGPYLIEKDEELPSDSYLDGSCFQRKTAPVSTLQSLNTDQVQSRTNANGSKLLVPSGKSRLNSNGPSRFGGTLTSQLRKPLSVVSNSGSSDIKNDSVSSMMTKNVREVVEGRRQIPPDAIPIYVTRDPDEQPCYLDGFIAKNLRPHQVEGVKFMFECLAGLRSKEIEGCILADSMGLGKTLQTIALIWVLLKQSPYSVTNSLVNKVVIVTPVSMVRPWQKEMNKWLGGVYLSPLIAIGDRDTVLKTIKDFANGGYRCIILAYETFRICSKGLAESKCDLLILDEGHRIKNMGVQTYQNFNSFPCRRRVILTGTPLQNCMEELYSCVSFVNPQIFPSLQLFKKNYSDPIMNGAEIARSNVGNKEEIDAAVAKATEKSRELTAILSSFMLRRTSKIIERLLPPRNEVFVLHKMSEAQEEIYSRFIQMNQARDASSKESTDAFSMIIALRKIVMHPILLLQGETGESKMPELLSLLTPSVLKMSPEEASPKFAFLRHLFLKIKAVNSESKRKEKMIVVSYFTTALDLAEKMCERLGLSCIRLDGSVPAEKRQSLIDRFNNPFGTAFVFLLAGKAGGTGLNLTVANRMVLLDPDWNPSNDLQVMARIWRDGQVLPVFIYRLVAMGTIEEKVLQRQFLKEKISDQVIDEKISELKFNKDELRNIFQFNPNSTCEVFPEEENQVNVACEEVSSDLDPRELPFMAFVKNRVVDESNNDEDDENEIKDHSGFMKKVKEPIGVRKELENLDEDEEDQRTEDEDGDEGSPSKGKKSKGGESIQREGGNDENSQGIPEFKAKMKPKSRSKDESSDETKNSSDREMKEKMERQFSPKKRMAIEKDGENLVEETKNEEVFQDEQEDDRKKILLSNEALLKKIIFAGNDNK